MTVKTNIKVAGTTFRPLPKEHRIAVQEKNVFEENGIPCAKITAILQPEPDNQYDPEAVKVVVKLTNGAAFHLGYLPKADPIKPTIKSIVLAEIVIKDFTVMYGEYNPSYLITEITMP